MSKLEHGRRGPELSTEVCELAHRRTEEGVPLRRLVERREQRCAHDGARGMLGAQLAERVGERGRSRGCVPRKEHAGARERRRTSISPSGSGRPSASSAIITAVDGGGESPLEWGVHTPQLIEHSSLGQPCCAQHRGSKVAAQKVMQHGVGRVGRRRGQGGEQTRRLHTRGSIELL